jgi:hypothetical protein
MLPHPVLDGQGHRRTIRITYPGSTMTDTTADRRVDAYIDALPDWQQRICRTVRALVHAADPEVTETIKRTNRPYFVLHGNICALQATKDHVNIFLYDPLVPDPEGIITSGHDNKTGRTVAIYKGERMDEGALLAMFEAIVAHNREGGWRKLTPGQ